MLIAFSSLQSLKEILAVYVRLIKIVWFLPYLFFATYLRNWRITRLITERKIPYLFSSGVLRQLVLALVMVDDLLRFLLLIAFFCFFIAILLRYETSKWQNTILEKIFEILRIHGEVLGDPLVFDIEIRNQLVGLLVQRCTLMIGC